MAPPGKGPITTPAEDSEIAQREQGRVSDIMTVTPAEDSEIPQREQCEVSDVTTAKARAGGLTIKNVAELEADLPPDRRALLVMIAVIQGYTLIGPLQHAFKEAMHISDTGTRGHVFTQAAALVQWGRFAMTLGQHIILSGVSPLTRVYMAMIGVALGAAIPPLCVFCVGSQWMGWVFLSFGLVGLSLGVFECAFLHVITPLGPLTKSWAIMGFPAAFFIINVFGFLLVSAGVPVQALFWYIVLAMPIGAVLFRAFIVSKLSCSVRGHGSNAHHRHGGSTAVGCEGTVSLLHSCSDWRKWLPTLVPFMAANIVGNFVMEGLIANFNTFNDTQVPLLGRERGDHLMDKNQFFAVFCMFVGFGDMISRRVGYCFSLSCYTQNLAALAFGLACCILGMYLTTMGVGVVAWISAFLTFWGQGFNYAVASKYIDSFVPRRHNLAAYSFWMFAGNAGAIAGSAMVDVVRFWICHDETYAHECLSRH